MKALNPFIAIALIFLLTSCSKMEESTPVSPQVNKTSLSKAHPVPFQFTFEAIGTFTPTSPVSIAGVLEGGGNATHVGKYTSISHDEVYYTSPTTGIIVNGTHTSYTANGEEMYATFTGTFVVHDGIGENTIDFIFNGGTGRFENLYGELQAVIITQEPGQLVQNVSGSGSGYIIY
jgi:hypothetical protein